MRAPAGMAAQGGIFGKPANSFNNAGNPTNFGCFPGQGGQP